MKTRVPEELRPALFEIRDRWLKARRNGAEVSLSPYMLSLLKLEKDYATVGSGDASESEVRE